jgi:hypothetical protein
MAPFTEKVWQIFHVDMEKTGLIGLERLVRLCGCLGPQGIEIAHAMAAQATIQARSGHIRVKKFARHGQQIVQWQQQHPAQLDHHGFLRSGQRRSQLKCCVRAILKAGSPLAAIFARIAGVVGACLCRDNIIAQHPPLRLLPAPPSTRAVSPAR